MAFLTEKYCFQGNFGVVKKIFQLKNIPREIIGAKKAFLTVKNRGSE